MLKMVLFRLKQMFFSKPNYSNSHSHLAALEILQKNGAIQVIYPKRGSGNIVNSPSSAVTHTEI